MAAKILLGKFSNGAFSGSKRPGRCRVLVGPIQLGCQIEPAGFQRAGRMEASSDCFMEGKR